mgnify:CR=1 FL=1
MLVITKYNDPNLPMCVCVCVPNEYIKRNKKTDLLQATSCLNRHFPVSLVAHQGYQANMQNLVSLVAAHQELMVGKGLEHLLPSKDNT